MDNAHVRRAVQRVYRAFRWQRGIPDSAELSGTRYFDKLVALDRRASTLDRAGSAAQTARSSSSRGEQRRALPYAPCVLPKKGSRRVTVDGVVYRWRESHGHRHFELRIEHFEQPGQLLVIHFAYLHLDPAQPLHVYRPIMTHRVLSAVVAQGRARGWTPERAGAALDLDEREGAAIVSEYDYRYSKWIAKRGDRYV